MLFAFTRAPSAERLRYGPATLQSNASVRDMPLGDVVLADPMAVFTDDLAPVEEVTRGTLAARRRAARSLGQRQGLALRPWAMPPSP